MVEEFIDIPYFMSNKDWYYYDTKDGIYKLTDKAPQDAIDSYNEFYSENDVAFD